MSQWFCPFCFHSCFSWNFFVIQHCKIKSGQTGSNEFWSWRGSQMPHWDGGMYTQYGSSLFYKKVTAPSLLRWGCLVHLDLWHFLMKMVAILNLLKQFQFQPLPLNAIIQRVCEQRQTFTHCSLSTDQLFFFQANIFPWNIFSRRI